MSTAPERAATMLPTAADSATSEPAKPSWYQRRVRRAARANVVADDVLASRLCVRAR